MASLRDLHLGAGRVVPARCLSVRTSRSGGPGGQHVNKTETRVELMLDLDALVEFLGEPLVARLRTRLERRLDSAGRVQVRCEEHRSQARNLDTALERMETLLREALVVQKKRRPTRPTRGSQERRLASKRNRSQVKKWRRSGPEE